jgi:hypothetical protein
MQQIERGNQAQQVIQSGAHNVGGQRGAVATRKVKAGSREHLGALLGADYFR